MYVLAHSILMYIYLIVCLKLIISFYSGLHINNGTCPWSRKQAKCLNLHNPKIKVAEVLYHEMINVFQTFIHCGTQAFLLLVLSQIHPYISAKRDCQGGQTDYCTKEQPCTPCELNTLHVRVFKIYGNLN